jgi:GTP:adenosylcobinamide-phosphate guanylyltransferase
MVTFVAEALAASPNIGRIFVIGPLIALADCKFPEGTMISQSGDTIIQTIKIGMDGLGHREKVLVVTADIPMLTSEAINDFLAQCADVEADLYYPIVTKQANNARYPNNKRTYVRLKEGVYTGGNIFLVNPEIIPRCMEVAERIIDNRKNPLKLCCILGWSFVIAFLLGLLSLGKVEKRVSEILGITGAVVLSDYPELGIDVDKPSDLELVRTVFSARA